ncbi:MAG: NAD+ synthase [Gammaproteobacteria bacterium]|nr:MAG: NAD+ synthase [Gammaproteobacteria bacterium]
MQPQQQLKVTLAQLNFLVGDIAGNTQMVIDASVEAAQQGSDLIIFPELTLTGYPPEDLLLRPSIETRIARAVAQLKQQLPSECYVLLGYPLMKTGKLYNAAGLFHDGKLLAEYCKQELPNYQVFDEKRYFTAGDKPCVVDICGINMAVSICEDIWHPQPMAQARAAGAQLMLNLNASPYHLGKAVDREALIKQRAKEGEMSILYTNLSGGQDELVFDGASMVVDSHGELLFRAPEFETQLYHLTLNLEQQQSGLSVSMNTPQVTAHQDAQASVYNALVMGVRDYINKNGFKGAVLGLSGGIDSAVTLAVAVDAIGPERVEAVMMPFRYTSKMSLEDAEAEAKRLGVRYSVLPIEPAYESFMGVLKDEFKGTRPDTTEENLQARCRGVLLMAISNKKGYIVLTTGNKSEMAVGYSTLYGDMAGGFDVLKDVPKTLVYQLANYRNQLTPENPPIPQNVIDRPPSAELAPDQKDQDSLPAYDELDQILEMYVEQDVSAEDIVRQGFARDVVHKVIRLVDLNEYKRRQAPVGVRISSRGFGRDRRYPMTCRWPAGE